MLLDRIPFSVDSPDPGDAGQNRGDQTITSPEDDSTPAPPPIPVTTGKFEYRIPLRPLLTYRILPLYGKNSGTPKSCELTKYDCEFKAFSQARFIFSDNACIY